MSIKYTCFTFTNVHTSVHTNVYTHLHTNVSSDETRDDHCLMNIIRLLK